MKKAIVFGASGFVGSFVLRELLNSSDYEQVSAVVRKDLNLRHPKLKVLIGDYHSLPGLKVEIEADEIFITLGTTKKNTPDRHEYYQVDHDYPVLAARLALEKGAKSVFLLTSVGADENSNIFYVRTKGETERDIIALNFEHTHIFRPSMLMGNRTESRPLEKVMIRLFSFVNPLLGGKLKKYRGIEGENLGKAMVIAAEHQAEGIKIYHWKDINDLLRAEQPNSVRENKI